MSSSNKLILLIICTVLFYKKNELLSLIEVTSKNKLKEHADLKLAGQEAMRKRKLYKKEESHLVESSRKKVDSVSEELDFLSNQKIKSYRLRYDIEHLLIVTHSIKDSDSIINKKLNNFLEISYNDFINSILNKK